MLNKELLNYQDRLFWVYRKVRENQIKEEGILLVKDFWHCDMVLKQNNHHGGDVMLLFLREIPEVEVLEVLPNVT
jgi:hypothetical protein